MKFIQILTVVLILCHLSPSHAHENTGILRVTSPETIRENEVEIDVPFAPANLKGIDKGTYVTLTWDPVPSYGPNGKPVITKDIYYIVYKALPIYSGGTLKEIRLTYLKRIKGSRTDCDVPQLNDGSVEPIYFAVSAENSAGESPISLVGMLKGLPSPIPYYESFAGGVVNSYIDVLVEPGTGSQGGDEVEAGVMMTPRSVDADGGAVAFYSYEEGPKVTMLTTKMDLGTVETPILDFHSCNARGLNRLSVTAIMPDATEIPVLSIFPGEEYESFSMDLSDMATKRWIRLEFTVEFDDVPDPEEGSLLLVDRLWVHDINDTEVASLPEVDIENVSPIYTLDGQVCSDIASVPGGRIIIIKGRKFILGK